MTIRIALEHHTEYRYDRLVSLSPHVIRLRPAPHCRTPILSYALELDPGKHFINWQQDPFGNYLARVVFPDKLRALGITVRITADMRAINPFDFFLEDYAERFPFQYPAALAQELAPYLAVVERGARLRAWLENLDTAPRQSVDFLVDVNKALARDIRYIVRMEPGVQSCEETLKLSSGSCRDSAWLLVQVLRHLGLASRFVSGYLVQLTADEKALDGPSGPEQDFTDLHAWAECYLPGAGWVGLDPTSGLFAGEGHIPLACAPLPQSAAPVSGTVDECKVEFHYANQVRRAHEDARVTKPYLEDEWANIMALGRQVDVALASNDIHLTQGGEPTFVSVDDMDGAEWNIDALGPNKTRLAHELVRRLKQRFAPGALLHSGQGKWYPGEPLPRWSLSCFWRRDGQPLWKDCRLIADESRDYGHGISDAVRFTEGLARKLGFKGYTLTPAYEDSLYYIWREARLPINVDLREVHVEDPLERARLRRLLDKGALGTPTGYVLPISWDGALHGFRTRPWSMRRERLHLIPGDSPMGYRLPLDSLPWEPLQRREADFVPDLFAPRPPLPQSPLPRSIDQAAQPAEAPITRTALCVEPRNGRLHCFMPPLNNLEAYVSLVAAVEDTAAALNVSIGVEGYEPPRDVRLNQFKITPDPGVIEVNIQPARDWDELAQITETLYSEARSARLTTEKFMLDGRHTGTGGGNHITLGGATPDESPFLRRPDLLGSLLRYWQQHPSLSYLFSGLFIGPTSQAPRVDEARDDALYELEIALAQLPEAETRQPWVVDRVLRNLLADMTGNTHRAEFCIDKLYSPDGPAERLGLVEMRAFEMPPHYRMSLAQSLLVRSLVARFAAEPHRVPLTHFGTSLQDRYLLPNFIWHDFKGVVAEQNRAGFPLQLGWYAPFFEFRFPRIGDFCADSAHLELRTALEPWHVLGEEQTRGGTARYVDSSVERVQVFAEGFHPDRQILVCNGRRVPLKPACERGGRVAGIRYKAWTPASGLHPMLPVHVPLRFDVIDAVSRLSLGGCTYHAAHPGGRHYDRFPVNANEAEGRRAARFFAHGGAGRGQVPPPEFPDEEFPYTLDLRKSPSRL